LPDALSVSVMAIRRAVLPVPQSASGLAQGQARMARRLLVVRIEFEQSRLVAAPLLVKGPGKERGRGRVGFGTRFAFRPFRIPVGTLQPRRTQSPAGPGDSWPDRPGRSSEVPRTPRPMRVERRALRSIPACELPPLSVRGKEAPRSEACRLSLPGHRYRTSALAACGRRQAVPEPKSLTTIAPMPVEQGRGRVPRAEPSGSW